MELPELADADRKCDLCDYVLQCGDKPCHNFSEADWAKLERAEKMLGAYESQAQTLLKHNKMFATKVSELKTAMQLGDHRIATLEAFILNKGMSAECPVTIKPAIPTTCLMLAAGVHAGKDA